jgi:hypothetical protein
VIIIYEVLTDMDGVGTYSFSRLNADCLYCYYLDYVAERQEKLRKVSNGFADVGLVAHKVLEDFGNGKLLQFELKDRFLADFEEGVPYGVKLVMDNGYVKDMTEKYKSDCAKFFEKYDGIEVGEQISAEEKFSLLLKIKDKTIILRGVIDCIALDSDGEYHIIDFKSKSAFKSPEELRDYARQLYLYSIFVKHKYGQFPKTLQFLQFRIDHTEIIKFSEDGLQEALDWTYNQTELLESEQFWTPKCLQESEKQKQGLKPDYFMGNNLCSYRFSCKYSPQYKGND